MFKKTVAALAMMGAAFGFAAKADAAEALNFGIISTESSANLKTIWDPFLADMTKQTGFDVKAFFASDYAGVIEAMRFKQVDVAWYGNKSAMEAVDRANGEIFVQTVAIDGTAGYFGHLIVPSDSPLTSLDDLLKHGGKDLIFGNGDPNSTSGFLVPGYYVFALNNIDPKTYFKQVLNAGHEANALAVANHQVDIATNNSENLSRLKVTKPEALDKIKIIWTSPLIPSDPIVWRKDLSDANKEKLKSFFLGYGTERAGVTADQVAAEKKVLAGLQWSNFKPSNDDQLIPIRQLEMFKKKRKLEADTSLAPEEKAKAIAEIDAQLKALETKSKTN
ncbi:phosphonate ABC transporter substrate-binding protein [Oleomonas cavernae]|uniref:Phosphonate ABC transporter substrate-binding protein n=1 Tax=Oleomonas cavernae TaxID=2320859 RepID=A0A418W9E0_9PROT|nr:phosphonate ABC transporter substrate-binding protein [Oleomonas cavernae]RJF86586.1 phosphonate ABC transporter substrate-binding protein [Oleomonas cavernae]